MTYLAWNKTILNDLSETNIGKYYNEGYVLTRPVKGEMQQTRSIRIDLQNFELSSENRRILRKTEEIECKILNLPLPNYHWSLGKMAKDFYETKFGKGTFSANKVKELLTEPENNNFNRLFLYTISDQLDAVGYCIALETSSLIHYSYPFYDIHASEEQAIQNIGMSMMIRAIQYAKKKGKKYIYLGSAQRPGDGYKLQFQALEWFDGTEWKKDMNELKTILKSLNPATLE